MVEVVLFSEAGLVFVAVFEVVFLLLAEVEATFLFVFLDSFLSFLGDNKSFICSIVSLIYLVFLGIFYPPVLFLYILY